MNKVKTPHQCFNDDWPQELQEQLIRIIFKDYQGALIETLHESYEPQLALDVLPHIRRSRIDSSLFRLSKMFPSLNARLQSNVGHNCHHAVLASGNVVLTISAVDTPKLFPRDALFRGVYAGDSELAQIVFDINPTTNIFEILECLPSPNERTYAVLLHGPAEKGLCGRPGFIQVAFPDEKFRHRLDRNIDLCKYFANVVSEMINDEIEQVPDKAEVKLKKPEQGKIL